MAESSEVSSLIKELRREHKLTQVQLANELGLAPTTVYRYEAGARPDTVALLALFRFAERKGPSSVRNALREIVSERIELPDEARSADNQAEDTSFVRTLTRATAQFNDKEKHRLLAFATFIRANKDVTAEKMIEVLLSPWSEGAKDKSPSVTRKKE